MTDLISRDDAIRELNGACSNWEDDAKVQEIVMALPSAEAVSRKAKCCPIAETCMSIDCPVSSEYIGRPSAEAVQTQAEKCDECIHKGAHKDKMTCKECVSAEAVQGWIPFTRRPMTEEEQKDYPNCTFMFDCVLPDDGDEILVSNRRFVWMDVFCNDIDGCYLDSNGDIDEDMAWMPLPKPYREESEVEK